MLRIALTCACTCALAAGGAYLLRAAESAPGNVPVITLAEARFDSHEEHGTGRVVAEVHVQLTARATGAQLSLQTSAIGTFVEALPGFEHMRGTNFQTALELENLLAEDALTIEAIALDSDVASVAGELLPVRRGALPQRLIRPDGSIDYDARSAEMPLEVAFAASDLPDGEWRVELRVHDRVRLAIEFAIQDGSGEIRGLRDHFPQGEESHP